MTLEPLPFDDLEGEVDECPVCGGDWVDCGCPGDQADAAWDELGGDTA